LERKAHIFLFDPTFGLIFLEERKSLSSIVVHNEKETQSFIEENLLTINCYVLLWWKLLFNVFKG